MNRDEVLRLIYEVVDSSQAPSELVCGHVIKRDVKRQLIWLEELGDSPVPVVGLRGHVKYYDSALSKIKTADIIYDIPKVGDTAVVLKQSGENRLAKCVGIILSTGYVGE